MARPQESAQPPQGRPVQRYLIRLQRCLAPPALHAHADATARRGRPWGHAMQKAPGRQPGPGLPLDWILALRFAPVWVQVQVQVLAQVQAWGHARGQARAAMVLAARLLPRLATAVILVAWGVLATARYRQKPRRNCRSAPTHRICAADRAPHETSCCMPGIW